jgi:hypothetical protein
MDVVVGGDGCLTGDVARSTASVFTSRFIGDVARVVV